MILLAVSTAPILTPAYVHAALPAGQLTAQEAALAQKTLTEIVEYTAKIIAVTDALFTGQSSYESDLAQLMRLHTEITALHAKINKTGSPYAQAIFGGLKGLAEQLRAAQEKWVETIKTKSLLKLKANRGFMNTRHSACLRFLLGGTNRDNTRTGEGLIGCFQAAGHTELKAQAEALLKNIDFIFTYGTDSASTKKKLAVHLNKHKGFSPGVRYLPKAFFNL